MKSGFVFFMVMVATAPSAFAQSRTLEQCAVKRVVYEGHFEEALSVEEYPEVIVRDDVMDGLVVTVGAMRDWSQGEGDTVRKLPSVGFNRTYSFQYQDGRDLYTLSIQGNPRRRVGKLYVQEEGSREEELVAILSCR